MKVLKYICGSIRIVFLFLIIGLIFLGYALAIKTFLKHSDENGFKLRQVYLKILNPLLGFDIEIDRVSHEKPALYIANHRGILDFFPMLRYLDAFILSKAEVRNIPVFGYIASFTGVFFVERDNKNSRKATREAIVKILKSGKNVILFPEGTTNNEKTTADFKIGAFEEVAKNGFPVVPIALEYKTKLDLWKDIPMSTQFFRQFGKCSTNVKLSFGPTFKNDDPKVLMNKSKEWIDSKLLEMHKGWSTVY